MRVGAKRLAGRVNGAGTHLNGGDDIAPVIVTRVEPQYAEEARAAKPTGIRFVRWNELSSVDNQDHRLRDQAIEAVGQ